MDDSDLRNRFAYHRPSGQGTVELFADLRRAYLELARVVNDVTPEGREKSLAITALEESCMWTIASIARTEPLAEGE